MKIVDCFIFYNELEMLNYRLNLLDPYVDYFIIVESYQTHIGKEKPLFLKENAARFKQFSNKIIHIIVELPHKYPCRTEKDEQWKNENYQRDIISESLDHIKLDKDDILILSDLDEIPNPILLQAIRNKQVVPFDQVSLEQDFYYYNLRCRFQHKWYHSKIIKYGWYKQSNLTLSKIRGISDNAWYNGGWHLSNFGDSEFISNKLKNFAHQEYNSKEFTDISNIEDKIRTCKDLFGRNQEFEIIEIKDNKNLPPLYEKYLANFQ